MALDPIGLMVMATGAVLAIIGYVLEDLGRAREAALGALLEREMTHAFRDPMPATGHRDLELTEFPRLSLLAAGLETYDYRVLPEPTPDSDAVPAWLRRALDEAGVCHSLDRDDQLVVFLRIPQGITLLDCPLTWACRVLPDGRGVRVRLSFEHGRRTYDGTLALRFTASRELRHAACLAQQEVLRIDFLSRDGDRVWRHGGSRLTAVPPGVAAQLRRALRRFGQGSADS